MIQLIHKFWATDIIDDSFAYGDQLMIYILGECSFYRSLRSKALLNQRFKALTSIFSYRPIMNDAMYNVQHGSWHALFSITC